MLSTSPSTNTIQHQLQEALLSQESVEEKTFEDQKSSQHENAVEIIVVPPITLIPMDVEAGIKAPTSSASDQTSTCYTIMFKVLNDALDKILLKMQFLHNFLKAMLETGLATALISTDVLGLEPDFVKIAYWSLAIAIPTSLFFSFCESLCHDAESRLIDAADIKACDKQLEEKIVIDLEAQQLTWSQVILGLGHYASDVLTSMQPLLLPLKLAGIDNHPWERTLTYVGLGLWGALGNGQELKNSYTSFRDLNRQQAIAMEVKKVQNEVDANTVANDQEAINKVRRCR